MEFVAELESASEIVVDLGPVAGVGFVAEVV